MLLRSPIKWQTLAIGLAIGVVSWLMMLAGITTRAELSTLDTRFLLRSIGGPAVVGELDGQTDARIVVVAIDSESLAHLGPWPWPRRRHAKVIQVLHDAGARAVAFDLIFAEPSSDADDEALADSIEGDLPVLLPVAVEGYEKRTAFLPGEIFPGRRNLQVERLTPPVAVLAQQATLGHIGILPDRDGIVRSVSSSINGIPAFSVQLARLAGLPHDELKKIPDQFIVNYAAFAGLHSSNSLFPIVPYRDVLEGRVNPDLFRDSVVLIGSTAPGLKADFFPSSLRILGYLPGVLFQAAATDSLLHHRYVTPFPSSYWGSLLLALAVGVMASVLFADGRPGGLILRLAGALIIIACLAQAIFMHNIWLLIVGPVLFPLGISFVGAIIKGQLAAERARELIRKTFNRYVPPSVLATLLEHPREVGLGGRERHIAVFFADFRGFTSFTEDSAPSQVVDALNRAFSRLVPIVERHGGIVDKFIGDALMAVFGAPVDLLEPEVAAVQAALDVLTESSTWGDFPVGIGLSAGTVVAGNIGTPERLNYTVVGHAVNTAARLEKLTGPGELIITADVYRKLSPELQQYFNHVQQVKLRGLSVPTQVYIYREEGPGSARQERSQGTLS